MRRKEMTLLIVAVAAAGILAGCGGTGNPAENTSAGEQAESEKTEGNIQENVDAASDETEDTDSTSEVPAVYMTTDISSEGMIAVYEALQESPEGNIAVKLSTGEPGSNYLRTDLIGDLVQSFDDPAIVECNTAYGGSRANTAMHYQVAEDHGYTEIADVDIMDEDGSMTLPVTGGTNLEENYVGSHFENYDYYVVLSHFKGTFHGGIRRRHQEYLDRHRFCGGASPIFTAAAPAAACGAGIRTRSWSPWRRPESLWWIIWTEIFCISMS